MSAGKLVQTAPVIASATARRLCKLVDFAKRSAAGERRSQ
jgi:hypothetical protein